MFRNGVSGVETTYKNSCGESQYSKNKSLKLTALVLNHFAASKQTPATSKY